MKALYCPMFQRERFLSGSPLSIASLVERVNAGGKGNSSGIGKGALVERVNAGKGSSWDCKDISSGCNVLVELI
jgi:hypothetical protein